MPPPPPPPGCFPFTRSKSSRDEKRSLLSHSSLSRSHTFSSSSTLTSRAEKLTFSTDSISWDNIPIDNSIRNSGSSRSPSGKNALTPVSSRTPSRSSSTKSKGFLGALTLTRNNSSSSTLVGSALNRKIADYETPLEPKADTTPRLAGLRNLMIKEKIDFYVVPSTDAHGSEYVASCDKRREWISGFTGSAGTVVVSADQAYLFTDSRYYIQAARELDDNWTLERVGWEGVKDWDEWLIDRARGIKIGVDSRMISYAVATKLNAALTPRASSLVFPWQNLVDLLWKDRPQRPKNPIFLQPLEFAGEDAKSKLSAIRKWIQDSMPETGVFTTKPPPSSQRPIGTFLASLASIAWTLNLRGSDIPFNPVFQAYLFITLERAILFIDNAKLSDDINSYLNSVGVSTKEYSDVWPFLRGKEWGEGKILLSSDIPYTVPRSLTSLRYTISPSFVEQQKAIKNEVEIEGFERAYMRDGAAMVRWYAWLDEKIAHGYEIDEYQAAQRLTEFRRQNDLYAGLAYESISACGPNAALPHYTPPRHDSRVIERNTPYLMDSGGQYRDGTCDTTRTVHFGRPTTAQSEAFTRVLQGHIAIDSAIFPEGTTGAQLDVLARRALWKDGLNYLHGTGHGFGSFLNVHEGPQGFGINVALKPGHVLTNEPGFYLEGEWGVRIESALVVQRVQTKGKFQGDVWLGFKRFTQVPIQVKMVKASLLSKEERAWVRNHNDECRRNLEPLLRDDKRALRWLRKECQPGFRSESSVSGVSVDWD